MSAFERASQRAKPWRAHARMPLTFQERMRTMAAGYYLSMISKSISSLFALIFGCVHGEEPRRQGVEDARDLGPQAVAEQVLALADRVHEERDLLVAQLHVGVEALLPLAAATDLDRLAAGRLHVLEGEVGVGRCRS